MSITRRLLDLARSNLNALIDRQGLQGADPDLGHYSDDELEAELELRRDRKKRQDATRAARESAERAARERSRTQAPPPSSTYSSTGNASSRARSTSSANTQATADRARINALYAQLETKPGADLDTLKKNFRRLMRQHHPDLNGGTPERLKAATERSMRLTSAYDELERMLTPTSR